jgi:hypothetical protein
VSTFSAEWLALREPFDAAARAPELVAALREHTAGRASLDVVDLGAGTGSNLRYLAPRIGGTQRWRLIDHDGALLDAAVVATRAWAVEHGHRASQRPGTLEIRADEFAIELSCERQDLRSPDAIALPAGGLVTAAALLDLVSRDWLTAVARRCRAVSAAVHFALTYDGRTSCAPAEPGDAEVLELVNRHQRHDKGFGPALGPCAAGAALAELGACGYRVAAARSDWRIGAASRAMQLALLDGWHTAAREIAPERTGALESWHARRRGHIEAGRSELHVGHVDVVGRR